MKIVVYVLNEDGTIPEYIVDGGYLPTQNSNESPQDFDFVGIANDEAPQNGFSNINELIEYIESNDFPLMNPITEQTNSKEYIAQEIWNKMEAIAG